MADRAVFDEDHWAHYSRVNAAVADTTIAALRCRDLRLTSPDLPLTSPDLT